MTFFELNTGEFVIPDYKTAKYTANQDKLLPMYRIQLNAYKEIAEVSGFEKVSGLFLVYFEPFTDTAEGMTQGYGFDMAFKAKTVPVPIDSYEIHAALMKTREIYDYPIYPPGLEGCKDCTALDAIFTALYPEE